MMKPISRLAPIAFVLLLPCTTMALADDSSDFADQLAGGKAHIVDVAPEDCARFAAHQPGGADYQPGVDVDGRAVAPADLNSTANIAPAEIITFSARIAPITDSGNIFNRSYMNLAQIEVDTRTGAVMINGQAMDNANNAIAQACANSGQH